jgi:hypothetical protein
MSVGEDSEEIEVLSRKEDGNLFDINEGFDWTKTIRIEDGKVVLSGVTTGTHNVRKLMKLSPNTKYTISIKAEEPKEEGEPDFEPRNIDHICIKRGKKADLPVLRDGEFAYCTDTNQLYVGYNGKYNLIGKFSSCT